MRARDVFRHFHFRNSTDESVPVADNDDSQSLREGVYSSVYRALLKRETGKPRSAYNAPYNEGLSYDFLQSLSDKLPPPVLNDQYQDMLLWLMKKGVPVTMADKNPAQAVTDLKSAGADERLLPLVKDYYEVFNSPVPPYEVVISAEFIPVRTLIVIEPEREKFLDFLDRKLYISGAAPRPGGWDGPSW